MGLYCAVNGVQLRSKRAKSIVGERFPRGRVQNAPVEKVLGEQLALHGRQFMRKLVVLWRLWRFSCGA